MSNEANNHASCQTAVSGRLSEMQSFFLDAINNSGEECNPCYLASLYYRSIGKRRHAASRDSFGFEVVITMYPIPISPLIVPALTP